MRLFFQELKQRRVYRVAIGYALVAWLATQIAATVLPAFHAPEFVLPVLIVLFAIGFPVALVLAWAFDVNTSGITKTPEPHTAKAANRRHGWLLGSFGLLIAVLAIGGYWMFRGPRSAGVTSANSAATNEKSIAVLPFENRSEDKANAYFADGIQDEILTRLSKIADLKVISRTSTQHYKSAPENLPEIARQVGVTNVLEGSVQKSGDQVRVNVQLINAANDSHIWAESFDRKLTDVFAVETEVAKAIADQLGAKITGREQQAISARPTESAEAYDAYLRGLAYRLKPGNTPVNALAAQKHLKEAVQLDPKFALAWALLAEVDARGYNTTTLPKTPALLDETRAALDIALNLQPNLGEALYAKGHFYYGCLRDYDRAVRLFEQSRQVLPNDSRVPEALAYIARRRGDWERNLRYFEEAERLDPRNVGVLNQHALSLQALRRFPEALRKLDQIRNITPDDIDAILVRTANAQAEGDLPRAGSLLAPLQIPSTNLVGVETQLRQAIYERDPARGAVRLQEVLRRTEPSVGWFVAEFRVWLGYAQQFSGDAVTAQQTWEQARSELEAYLKQQPQNGFIISDLALVSAGLGDKAAAFRFAEQAITANPIEGDHVYGPAHVEVLARVAALTEENDRAISLLEQLLATPYAPWGPPAPLTPALLRLDPMFDSLRNDPRFQQLTKE